MTAECKWCGQALILDLPENSSEFEIEEAMVNTCTCVEAVKQRQLRTAAREAQNNVRELCLNADPQSGLKPCDERVTGIAEDAIDLMVQRTLNEITIKMPNKGTLSVKLSSGGKFTVQRKIQRGQKRESE